MTLQFTYTSAQNPPRHTAVLIARYDEANEVCEAYRTSSGDYQCADGHTCPASRVFAWAYLPRPPAPDRPCPNPGKNSCNNCKFWKPESGGFRGRCEVLNVSTFNHHGGDCLLQVPIG